MKPWIEDTLTGVNLPLFYHKGRQMGKSTEGQEIVHKILDHRPNSQGQLEFHTLWEGTGEDTWEPAENFIDGVCEPWIKYCKDHGLIIRIPGL